MKLVFFLYAFLVAASLQEIMDRACVLYHKARRTVSEQVKVGESNYQQVKEQVRNKIQEMVNKYNERSLKKEIEEPKQMSVEEFKRKIEELARMSAEIGEVEDAEVRELESEKDESKSKQEL